MRSIEDLPEKERLVLEELKSGIRLEFPGCSFQTTLFGSEARGDALSLFVDRSTRHYTVTHK